MLEVSVIMGIYNSNQEPILRLAVESILNQTLQNFEFIICDDGSIDGTYELVYQLTQCDKRVILLKNEKNKGLAFSLNRCLELAKGKYIARMDADDISSIDRLEKQISFLEKYQEYSMVGCNADLINDQGIWGRRIYKKNPTKKDFLFNSPFMHPTILIRREVLISLNGYRVAKETLRMEDYDLFMRMYASGYKGCNLQKFLYQFREDQDTYKRRKYKYRFHEVIIRYQGFKKLGMLLIGIPYVLKPLIVGLIPHALLKKLRREKI